MRGMGGAIGRRHLLRAIAEDTGKLNLLACARERDHTGKTILRIGRTSLALGLRPTARPLA